MPAASPRVRLVPVGPAHLLTLIEEPGAFAERFGLPLADGVAGLLGSGEVSPAWRDALRSATAPDPWTHGFAIVERGSGAMVGFASFKGPPDPEGAVEIAYGVTPAVEGRGYATEAATALVAFANADPRVRLVRAHTLPRAGASPRVLEKNGFAFVGEVVDPEDGPVWRWERAPAPPA